MKKLIIISLVLGIAVFCFLLTHNRTGRIIGSNVNTAGTPFTNEGFTWHLGTVVINGTNVSPTNITVRVK